MSTRTIAIDSQVYEKLARHKFQGESFTKVIARLLEAHGGDTCDEAVKQAAVIWSNQKEKGLQQEAELMESVVQRNREQADWQIESLE